MAEESDVVDYLMWDIASLCAYRHLTFRFVIEPYAAIVYLPKSDSADTRYPDLMAFGPCELDRPIMTAQISCGTC